jgi:hypothetical protein
MRPPRDLEELLQVSDDHAITLRGEARRGETESGMATTPQRSGRARQKA